MLSQFVERLQDKAVRYKIHGRGLLYKVDLILQSMGDSDLINVETKGSIRVGPLKSFGQVLSSYRRQSVGYRLTEHDIEFKGIGFKESYYLQDQKMMFSKNSNSPKKVEDGGLDILDPLPLMLNLMNPELEKDVQFSGNLLLGGKLRPFDFLKEEVGFELKLSGKILFTGQFFEAGAVLNIPKFKAKLKMEKINF